MVIVQCPEKHLLSRRLFLFSSNCDMLTLVVPGSNPAELEFFIGLLKMDLVEERSLNLRCEILRIIVNFDI